MSKPTFEQCLDEAYEEHVEAFYEEQAEKARLAETARREARGV